MNEQKKLYKDSNNKMICGVCAGLAEYLNMDVSVVRLIVVLLVFGAGTGLLAYFVAAIILPEKSEAMGSNPQPKSNVVYDTYEESDKN
ncbi:MAG: PspC domain-containing protein [Ruminococcus sp.]|jgi:phage shock protein PspC (stress-responsive transcriptional regulator)|nr:PspC domain-containing protein [Ruminococcus sp.]